MGKMRKLLALALSLCLLLGTSNIALAGGEPEARDADTLLIGYTEFNEKFSDFFAESAYDRDVSDLTNELLYTYDRLAGIVYNAIEGETIPYNGTDYTYTGLCDTTVEVNEAADTTVYTIKLREGVTYSDGVPMTADDLIFTYYVYLDPTYDGPGTLNSYDIVGLKAYQTQTPEDIYNKYDALVKGIYAAGADHEWAEGDDWTQQQQEAFWAGIQAAWTADVQEIVDFVAANYNDDEYAPEIGSTPDAIAASEGLQIAFGMVMWGFGEYDDESGVLSAGESAWNLAEGEYPAIGDFYAATYAAYEGNPEAFYGTEAVNPEAQSTLARTQLAFIGEQAKAEPEAAAGVPNIAGIKKLDEYTVEVTLQDFSAPAIYQIIGPAVSPLHYYGDKDQYDYENNRFGFPFGDLSLMRAKTTEPLGNGPYKFVKYENKVVYLEANEHYWRGAPKVKNLMLKETLDADKVTGVVTGALDITDPSFNVEAIKAIKDANGGELNGGVIHCATVDNLGYGYIGATATNVCVGGEPGSEASKNLRRGLMTALALYRDVVVDSYYGEIASVINYPISNTSWAAPQKTDSDYKVAFSTDVDGKDIYTADMDMAQREEAALQAIIGFLKAAGYTFDEAAGKFTAAPEGAEMEYDVIIGGGGSGDHPSFGILTDTKGLLDRIGVTLTISDIADFSVIMDRVKSANAQFFCMAWQVTIDPDMYQVYHSSNVLGAGGTDSNQYMVTDPELDQLIMDARTSPDQAYRKAVYKAALDKVIDWAVELPVYQRQNCIIFSTERVNLDSIVQDHTTYWEYLKGIWLVEMK